MSDQTALLRLEARVAALRLRLDQLQDRSATMPSRIEETQARLQEAEMALRVMQGMPSE